MYRARNEEMKKRKKCGRTGKNREKKEESLMGRKGKERKYIDKRKR